MTNTTNFITPPDFVDDKQHTILLIDVDPVDVETLAYLCGGHNESFNIYLYKADMLNLAWLDEAAAKSDAIIINTVENDLSRIKDAYATKENAYHYGPKHFLNNKRQQNTVLDYFVNRAHDQSSTISAL